MKKIFFILFTLILTTSGCEDVIELDVPEGRTRLVVDGLVADAYEVQTVKLKYSAPYFSNTETPAATGAEVIITDSKGNEFVLEEAEPGIYQSAFKAQTGTGYSLYVKTAEGEEFRSPMQRMEPVASLDTIYYEFVEKSIFNEEEGYVVVIECSDIEGVENFFRWKYFVNGEFQDNIEDLAFTNDRFVDGSQGLTVTFSSRMLQPGDMAKVEQMSVTREAYNFMNLLREQVYGGGQFSTPPAPVRGNVVNISNQEDFALGFFMVSSIVSKEVEIKPIEQ